MPGSIQFKIIGTKIFFRPDGTKYAQASSVEYFDGGNWIPAIITYLAGDTISIDTNGYIPIVVLDAQQTFYFLTSPGGYSSFVIAADYGGQYPLMTNGGGVIF